MSDSRKEISGIALEEIFHLIKEETGHDFTRYKRNTIFRRITRRLATKQILEVEQYIDILRKNSREVRTLCKELLVSVTGFFRDREIFDYIQHNMIEEIFNRASGERIRIWVPACASGEEAYSWGMLFQYYMDQHELNFDIQIFASDIDRMALNRAREGVYSKESVEGIPEAFLERYFIAEREGYRVCRTVREMILFAEQNLISDPPYSKMDLISCRNLLIYLDVALQQQATTIFNYALQTGGYLVLGNAETLGNNAKYFKVINRKYKIFQKLITKTVSGKIWTVNQSNHRYTTGDIEQKEHPPLNEIARRMVLDRFTPPGLIIDHQGNILYIQGKTGRFLELTTGEISNQVFQTAREGLKIALANGIRKVKKLNQEVVIKNLRVKGDHSSGDEMIDLILTPIKINQSDSNLILVIFQSVVMAATEISGGSGYESNHILELERELQDSQEFLQNTIEELETANEELKSANEEARSTNEELQSTNEELETSKEELQATNEELIITNSELQHKIEELSTLNNDMKNLLTSTQIATVFLDKQLRIFRFTPAISRIIDLLESDIGRSIKQFTNTLNYASLAEDALEVLERLIPKEIEVKTVDQRFYWMRILPYRTIDDSIEGVVITFTDISEKRDQERELEQYKNHLEALIRVKTEEIRQNEEKFSIIFENMINGFAYHQIVVDEDGKPIDYLFQEVNSSFERLTGLKRGDLIGKPVTEVLPGTENDPANWIGVYGEVALFGKTITFENYSEAINKWFKITAYSPRKGYFATIFEDITDRVETTTALKEREHFQQILLDTTFDIIYIYDIVAQKNIYSNQGIFHMMGYTPEEIKEFGDDLLSKLLHPDDFDNYIKKIVPRYSVTGDDEVIEHEYRMRARDGSWHWLSSIEKIFTRNEAGEPVQIFGTVRDITRRKKIEEAMIEHQRLNAIGEMAAAIAHDFNNALQAIIGSVDLAQINTGKPDKLDRYLTTIKTVSGDIATRVRLLQRFGGDLPEQGQRSKLNLNSVIEEAMIQCRPLWKNQMERHGIVIQMEPTFRDIPEISGDPSELRTVVYNLIRNSVEAMPEGGKITLETNYCNGMIVFRVTDTGTGMDEETLKRAFQPFYSTRGFEMGRGLGLSNAYSIVREHQGRIMLKKSIPGKGTTFELQFPAVSKEKESGSVLNGEQKKSSDQFRILWVDDDDMIRDIAEEILEMLSYQCDVVSSGERALELLGERRYDLVITDIGMPGMNGWQLAREIRHRLGRDQKVVVVTGWGDQIDPVEREACGIDDVLGKPLMIDQIETLLKEILSS